MVEKFAVMLKNQVAERLNKGDSKGAMAAWVFGKGTTKKSSVALWCHEPDTYLPAKGWKWHDDEQIEYIVSGKLLIQFPDEYGNIIHETVLEPGDFVFIAAYQKHRGKVIGDENAIGVMFSPRAYSLPAGQPQLYDCPDHD